MDRGDSVAVLWLTPDKPANISVGRRQIADRLDEKAFDVTVRPTTLGTFLELLRTGREYDVLIGTTRAGAIVGSILSLLHRRPLIVDHIDPIAQLYETHGPVTGVLVERLENLTFRIARRVLYVYEEEESRIGKRSQDFSQTTLGVDYERFASPSDAAVSAAKETLSEYELRDNLAIYVGGLEPMYHILECIAAFDHLDDWSFLLLGTGSLEREVARAAADRENVIYLGSVPYEQIPGYLRLSDIGLALVDDPHTLKVLEYLAAGLGVVQLRGRAEDRFEGMVEFSSTEPTELAEAVRAAKRLEVSSKTHDYIKQFEWNSVSNVYSRAILELVAP